MAQSIAHRLVSHCPTGPVLDMLVSSTGRIPTSGLSGVPSEAVSWPLYKKLSAEEACVLVRHATSPELLRKIFAREKRVSVRRAFATNEHLPEDLHEALARHVEEHFDAPLAANLLRATPPERRIPLMLRPGFHSCRSSHEITNAVLGVAPELREDLVLEQLQLLTPHMRWELAASLSHIDSVRPVTLLDLIIDVPPPPRTAVDGIVRSILERAEEAERPRLAADILEYVPETGALAVLVGRLDECELDLHQVLDAVRAPEDRVRVWAAAIAAEIELDLVLARRLLVDSEELSEDQRARLRCTPEARSFLLAEGSLGLQAVLLRDADAPTAVRALNTSPELRSAFRCTGERLEELYGAGLDEDVLVELCQSAGVNRFSLRASILLTPALRQHMVMRGPSEVFTKLDLTSEEAELLLRRDDVRADPELALLAFTRAAELPDDLRRATIEQLPAQTVATLLQSGRSQQLRAGDLTWLLDTEHGSYLRAELPQLARSFYVDGVWVEEGVRLLSLPWASLSSPRALKAVAETLLELLGDDLSRWAAALSLLSEWEGTLPELVETLDQLG